MLTLRITSTRKLQRSIRRSGVVSLLLLAGCLSRFTGGGLPGHIQTVAVIPFENQTASAELRASCPRARSCIAARASRRIRAGPTRSFAARSPSTSQTCRSPSAPIQSGHDRAPTLQITVDIEIVDQTTGKTIWERKGLSAEGEYAERAEPTGRHRPSSASSTTSSRERSPMVRPGRDDLGCLLTCCSPLPSCYFAVNIGEVYVRYYRTSTPCGRRCASRRDSPMRRSSDGWPRSRIARTSRGGRSRPRRTSNESMSISSVLRARRAAVHRPGYPLHAAGRVELLSDRDPARKVMTWETLGAGAAQRGRVVFTNGVFDLLHPGHVDVLRGARARGRRAGRRRQQRRFGAPAEGSRAARASEAERAYVLAALEAVDAVVSLMRTRRSSSFARCGPT